MVGSWTTGSVGFLYSIGLAAVVAFGLVLLSRDSRYSYLLDVTQHEWYRELRRDYHTSRQQLRTDWRLLRSFADRNRPWMWASGFGLLGIILSGSVLIMNLPEAVHAGVAVRRSASQESDAAAEPTIDTRATDPDLTGGGRLNSVLVSIPPSAQPVFPQTQETQPETGNVQVVAPPVIDLDEAFADFRSEPPERQPAAAPDFAVTIERTGDEPDFDETFEVRSEPIVDLAETMARLRPDAWQPTDVAAPRLASPPMLYRERYGSVRLSQHERAVDDGTDGIRIRPRAAGRESGAGVLVSSTKPVEARTGVELTYRIDVTNPASEVLPGVIVEESLPVDWQVVDANPTGELTNANVLRWEINDLRAGETRELSVRVIPGADRFAQSSTLVTVGASVEMLLAVDSDSSVQTPDPGLVAEEWQASDAPRIAPVEPPVDDAPVSPTRGSVRKAVPSLDLTVQIPADVRAGKATVEFVIRNTGTIAADGAQIVVWLPDGVTHLRGPRIKHRVPRILPGGFATVRLEVSVAGPGGMLRVELRNGQTVFDLDRVRLGPPIVDPEVAPASWQRRRSSR